MWQTGTVRLLSRMLIGRRTGPVFLTDRKAKPSVALVDVDPTTGRARLSYRRDEVVTGQGGVELASP